MSVETRQLVNEFPELFKRQGEVNNYKTKINLKSEAKESQQKGRLIPIQLQKAVDEEINHLLKEGYIEKIDGIKDDVFIQPTVITVKKDRSEKIALDARALNQAIDKDKHQMPNLDNLLDMVAEKLDTEESEAWFFISRFDLCIRSGSPSSYNGKTMQFSDNRWRIHWNIPFSDRFLWSVGYADRISKVMDNLLAKFREVFVFIDDILIVTKGTKQDHIENVRETFKTLNAAKLQLKAGKCNFAKQKIEWLGFKLTNHGISPVNSKVQGITEKLRPTNFKNYDRSSSAR